MNIERTNCNFQSCLAVVKKFDPTILKILSEHIIMDILHFFIKIVFLLIFPSLKTNSRLQKKGMGTENIL